MGCYCSTPITYEEHIYRLIKSYSFLIVKCSQIKDIYDYIVSKSESYIMTNNRMTTKKKKYILYKDFSLIHITKNKSESFINILNKDKYMSIVYRILLSTSLPNKTNSIMLAYFNRLYDKIPYSIKYPILKTIFMMIISPVNYEIVYKKYIFDCIYYLSIYYHMNLINESETDTDGNTMKNYHIKTYSQTDSNIYNTNNNYKINNNPITNTNREYTDSSTYNTNINIRNSNNYYLNLYRKTYNFQANNSNSNQILLHHIINKKIIHKDILIYLLKVYISLISADSLLYFLDDYCVFSDKNKNEAVSSFKNHWNHEFIEEFIENRLINTSFLCLIQDFPKNEYIFIEKFITNSLHLLLSYSIYDDMIWYYKEKFLIQKDI